VRRHRVTLLALVPFATLLAACVPGARGQEVQAPRVAQPTLAEYVHTLQVYDGVPGAVQALEADVFGDLGPGTVACVGAISWRESNDSWWASNASGATGLMQLLGHGDLAVTVTGSADVRNPWVNLRTARALSSDGENWRPWTPTPAACR
jgi:hypothetical protein